MERANLKARRPDLYERLESSWYAWNEGMLPEIDESTTGGQTGPDDGRPPWGRQAERKGRQPAASEERLKTLSLEPWP